MVTIVIIFMCWIRVIFYVALGQPTATRRYLKIPDVPLSASLYAVLSSLTSMEVHGIRVYFVLKHLSVNFSEYPQHWMCSTIWMQISDNLFWKIGPESPVKPLQYAKKLNQIVFIFYNVCQCSPGVGWYLRHIPSLVLVLSEKSSFAYSCLSLLCVCVCGRNLWVRLKTHSPSHYVPFSPKLKWKLKMQF